MESEVQAFYKNKTVFMTGGSGFLGKVYLEKLLRATDVGRIYMLLRPKKGKDIRERIQAYASLPLFELLLKHKPTALERIVPIAGDCGKPELGLSATDRQRLVNEVHIVVHTAATVRFDEPLHNALCLNVRSVHIMLELAKKMQNLESFVHVSTAYSNCVVSHIDEKYYPENISCTGQEALNLLEKCNPKLLEKMTAGLQGEFPNTYTFTKALAEDLFRSEAADLPFCIYRPSIILASYKEPVSGWVDNFYGTSSMVYGVSVGVVRVAPCKSAAKSSLVPVDYCANMMLVCAWKTARDAQLAKISKQPAINSTAKPIYNHVSSMENDLTWIEFKDKMMVYMENYALTKMMWYPFVMFINYNILYKLMTFLLHTLPAHAVDLLLRLMGKKTLLG